MNFNKIKYSCLPIYSKRYTIVLQQVRYELQNPICKKQTGNKIKLHRYFNSVVRQLNKAEQKSQKKFLMSDSSSLSSRTCSSCMEGSFQHFLLSHNDYSKPPTLTTGFSSMDEHTPTRGGSLKKSNPLKIKKKTVGS